MRVKVTPAFLLTSAADSCKRELSESMILAVRLLHVVLLLALALLVGIVTLNPQVFAKTIEKEKRETVTLLAFESQSCSECQDLAAMIEELQKELPTDKQLVVIHHRLESSASEEVFIRYQITKLPSYLILNQDEELLYSMKELIEPESLLWEIKEALGKNEILKIPEEFAALTKEIKREKAPMILLFRSFPEEKEELMLLQVATVGLFGKAFADPPLIFSFDTDKPSVQRWMNELGLYTSPAYLLVSPSGSVYLKSESKAYPWQLEADLRAYAKRFNSEFQNILVRLTEPSQSDEGILPATMPPQSSPASGEPLPL